MTTRVCKCDCAKLCHTAMKNNEQSRDDYCIMHLETPSRCASQPPSSSLAPTPPASLHAPFSSNAAAHSIVAFYFNQSIHQSIDHIAGEVPGLQRSGASTTASADTTPDPLAFIAAATAWSGESYD